MEQEFNNLYTQEGGFVETYPQFGHIRYAEVLALIVEVIVKDLPVIPNIFIGFYNNTKLGASVKKQNDSYFIGISLGSITVLKRLFTRMLCNPSVLPGFGHVGQAEGPQIFNAALLDVDLFLFAPDDEELIIHNPERKSLVEVLTLLALIFLTFHELGHVLRGHLDYIHKITNSLDWQEATMDHQSIARNPKIPSIQSQALEMDADTYTASRMLWLLSWFCNKPTFYTCICDELKSYNESPLSLLELMLFSCNSCFRLFGNIDTNVNKWLDSSHPPGAFRNHIINATVCQIILVGPKTRQSFNANFLDRACEVVRSTSTHVEQAFAFITINGAPNRENIILPIEQSEYSNQIKSQWNELRPSLLEYAFEVLPQYSELLTKHFKFDR